MTATCICATDAEHKHEAGICLAMPKYFFHVLHGDDSYQDRVGEELPDNVAAWHEATISAGQSIRDLDGKLTPGTSWCMQVVNEAGGILYRDRARSDGEWSTSLAPRPSSMTVARIWRAATSPSPVVE